MGIFIGICIFLLSLLVGGGLVYLDWRVETGARNKEEKAKMDEYDKY